MLENRDALLSLGLAPWVLGLAWMAVAVIQEPMLLRQHGIHLSHEAAFVAWIAILLQALWAKDRHGALPPWTVRLMSNALLLMSLAGGLMITICLTDCFGQGAAPNWIGILRPASVFVIAWLPIASLNLASIRPRGHKMLWLAFLCFSMVLTIKLDRLGVTSPAVLAASMAEAGAILLALAYRSEN